MSTATTTTGGADTAAVRRAIASTERPPRPGRLSTALTFGWRGMLKVKHVPEQLVDVTITPVMFVLMFTYLFGGAIAGSTSAYLQYILPGMLVMSVLFTTVYSGISLNTDLTKGVVDRFRSLPIWRPAPLLGSLHVRLLEPGRRPDAARVLEGAVGTAVLEPDPAALSVPGSDAQRAAIGVAELARAGIGIADFSLDQPSMDEVFLALTGHAADTGDKAAEQSSPTLEEQVS